MKLSVRAKLAASSIVARVSPTRLKAFIELRYWKIRKKHEGKLQNSHYEYFYTRHFDLDASYYSNKVILDIGCGPRGSLEWATMAARRIGVDPLASEYQKLGTLGHEMEYLCAPSEHIPVPDKSCDAVFSFNSLDHVNDVDKTIMEIKRITHHGGIFLLLVEVNHQPTATEPHMLTPRGIQESLEPEFTCLGMQVYEPVANGIYDSVQANVLVPSDKHSDQIGYLSAKFLRN